MIALPPGFDASAYVSDLFSIAAPFITVAVLIAAAVLIKRALRR
jgi:hypothetical protein